MAPPPCTYSIGDEATIDHLEDGVGVFPGSHELDEAEVLAQTETWALRLLRALLVLVLVSSTVVASYLVYRFAKEADEKRFLSEFANFAEKVVQGIHINTEKSLASIDAFATAITSYSKTVNASWPFVTFPDFHILGASARNLVNASSILLLPIVGRDKKAEWEKYSVANIGWLSATLQHWAAVNTTLPVGRLLDEFDGSLSHTSISQAESSPTKSTVFSSKTAISTLDLSSGMSGVIWEFSRNGTQEASDPSPFLPIWQMSPSDALPLFVVNFNELSISNHRGSLETVLQSRQAVISSFELRKDYFKDYETVIDEPTQSEPNSMVRYPVFDDFSPERNLVAVLSVDFYWSSVLTGILPTQAKGVDAVIQNGCSQTMTYRITGPNAQFVGSGDLHDTGYNRQGVTWTLDGGFVKGPNGVALNNEYCPYHVTLFPSNTFQEEYTTRRPTLMIGLVVAIIGFTTLVFWLYDRLIERRQTKVMQTALRTSRIVASLFPSSVRDRLFERDEVAWQHTRSPWMPWSIRKTDTWKPASESPKARLRGYLRGETIEHEPKAKIGESEIAKPIAELFPNTTVLFADIAGFTAWSSAREPSQVFILLETLYRTFDKAAKRRGVFKVETIGDCYMAVTGLPDPQDDHAVIMARFAQDCLTKMRQVTRKLELTLGPDTADLSLRIGIHSGPVTAGVLRGEKSRFQLFGDTVNTASRMESTGQNGRIQLSQQTADLLCSAGKPHWIAAREDLVFAKGKGELNTFWLDSKTTTQPAETVVSNPVVDGPDSRHSRSNKEFLDGEPAVDCHIPNTADASHTAELQKQSVTIATHQRHRSVTAASKTERLIKWNADVLERSLKAIVAYRGRPIRRRAWSSLRDESQLDWKSGGKVNKRGSGSVGTEQSNIMDEVVETIAMPMFDPQKPSRRIDTATIVLSSEIQLQLLDYITTIASMYQDIPFHNFEHASHVTMSANKLLQRIVMPDEIEYRKHPPPVSSGSSAEQRRREKASALHKYTFGITSDPLTQFAIVFSAFVHDVDHSGLTNSQLVNKKAEVALRYNNKSVAEQNSIHLAWHMLMEPKYSDLRRCIAPAEDDLKRFRQIVVNSVMATDIFDEELQVLRKSRWTKAFQSVSTLERSPLSPEQDANRKATIVIEHLIQASDVTHTMQHWHVYCKWNQRLFREMYAAYDAGQARRDPAIGWYQQELDFFDSYVIPLAMKLKECGVFGVSGDEYLTYAMENRREWAQKGKDIVVAMVSSLKKEMTSGLQTDELEDSTLEFAL